MAGWQDRILKSHDWQTFDKAAPDPVGTARAKVLKDIDKSLEALAKGDVPRGMKVKTHAEDDSKKAIGLRIKAGNKLVRIGGHDEIPVPMKEAEMVLRDIRKDVEAKKLDDDIAKSATGGTSTPRKSSGGGAGWSEERRAKFAKTVAERKAKEAAKA